MSTEAAPSGAREILENMLGHLGFAFSLEEEKRGEDSVLHVRMQNPARLIGREGEVIDDLQFLLNRMMVRGEEPAARVIVDVENFRKEQEAGLLGGIRELVERVRTGGETVELQVASWVGACCVRWCPKGCDLRRFAPAQPCFRCSVKTSRVGRSSTRAGARG